MSETDEAPMSSPAPEPRTPAVDAGRLWAGGAAAALVAVLIAVAGILLARGVFDIPLLAPEGDGVWGDATTPWYASMSAVAALLATALVHALISTTPRPRQFFGWIVGLATVIGVLLPFTSGAALEAKVATAVLNAVLGVAIGMLVSAVAASAMLRGAEGRRPR